MVNIFLRAIYLYDDRMTLILNGGDRQITIDDILLDKIEEHFESAVSNYAGCSPLVVVAPPSENPVIVVKSQGFPLLSLDIELICFALKAAIRICPQTLPLTGPKPP